MVVQSDLLEAVDSRVVIPLVAEGTRGPGLRSLNPKLEVGGDTLMLLPQQMATVIVRELGGPVARLDHERDRITRAIEALLSGI